MFKIGQTYQRTSEINDKFGGNRQSGISSSAKFPYVFLFSSPLGEQYGYTDGWRGADRYTYSGEGQVGNQEMVRGNRQVRDHFKNGKGLHLFERRGHDLYEYIGEFAYVSHEISKGKDSNNRQREIFVFHLRPVDSGK